MGGHGGRHLISSRHAGDPMTGELAYRRFCGRRSGHQRQPSAAVRGPIRGPRSSRRRRPYGRQNWPHCSSRWCGQLPSAGQSEVAAACHGTVVRRRGTLGAIHGATQPPEWVPPGATRAADHLDPGGAASGSRSDHSGVRLAIGVVRRLCQHRQQRNQKRRTRQSRLAPRVRVTRRVTRCSSTSRRVRGRGSRRHHEATAQPTRPTARGR